MKVAIIGAGGHSKVVTDTFQCMGYEIVGYYNDKKSNALGTIADIKYNPQLQYFCAIGSNTVRKQIVENLDIPPEGWATAIHPSAVVSKSAIIGKGILICAGAVIQPAAYIGDHVIINTNVSIDHDCVIGDFCHIAPRSVLCGNVNVGSSTFICAGCTIINEIQIGTNVLLGAASLVIRNIPNNVKAYGVPSRVKL